MSSLQNSGVAPADISVLLPDKRGTKDFAHEHNTKAPEGAVAGVAGGGLVGGTIGLLAGIGALARCRHDERTFGAEDEARRSAHVTTVSGAVTRGRRRRPPR